MNADAPHKPSGEDRAIDGLLHEAHRMDGGRDFAFLDELKANLDQQVEPPVTKKQAVVKHKKRKQVWIPIIAGIAATGMLLLVFLPQLSPEVPFIYSLFGNDEAGPVAADSQDSKAYPAYSSVSGEPAVASHLKVTQLSEVDLVQIRKPLWHARISSDYYEEARGGTLRGSNFEYIPDASTELDDPAFGSVEAPSAERYGSYAESTFLSPLKEALSTFSIDVDTASYSNIRRMITDGQAVPPESVRIEEMINYFDYHYPQPKGEHPFAAHLEVAACPWQPGHHLVRIGLQGRTVVPEARPSANLVFLLDISGSMNTARKLPLLKTAMHDLVDQLNSDDVVSIVVYAGSEGLALEPTSGDDKPRIHAAIDQLNSGGSTAGAAGIGLAYQLARKQFVKGGINRVILGTDGDFNVGISDNDSLVALVEREARSKVFLTVLGFGTGNLNDQMLEEITNKGNGSYHYIDSAREGRKVLVEQMSGTLLTIAKDVKIQVEFNPAYIQEYRLVGYDNRRLRNEDFTNDQIDAGDIGSGHSVTALYEVQLVGAEQPGGDALKYQPSRPQAPENLVRNGEWLTVKLRYKQPDADTSIPLERTLRVDGPAPQWEKASADFRFASAVAGFGLILRDSGFRGQATHDLVLELVDRKMLNGEQDPQGRKAEFVELVRRVSGK
ncbi:MAG: Ca-activated chloride channel family protein [Candidatus Omnitrophota bacterium]|jgi:Ca-activated chloride channel family protein